jgi:hypothetical protein
MVKPFENPVIFTLQINRNRYTYPKVISEAIKDVLNNKR